VVRQKKTDKNANPDVIVVGGGLAGLSLTALLAAKGVRALCLDRAAALGNDTRTTAISWASRNLLKEAGAWDAVEQGACPIRTIDITESGSAPLLTFNAEETGEEAFGWIVENRNLRQSLLNVIESSSFATHLAGADVADFSAGELYANVHLSDGRTFSAPLIAGADGRESFLREWMGIGTRGWMYNQRAIVCIVAHSRPHHNGAVEDFRASGPFAILPMADSADGVHRSAIVWTEHGPLKASALRYNEQTFNAALSARFPESYGTVKKTGDAAAYPLGLVHAHAFVSPSAPRMALVAEAAHVIHPIAGQGLNMGFRDVHALATLVAAAKEKGEDVGSLQLLQAYQRLRRFDTMTMTGATDILNRLFSNSLPVLGGLRRLGLAGVNKIPKARLFFMRRAMGMG